MSRLRAWPPRVLLLIIVAFGLTAMHTIGHATHTPIALPAPAVHAAHDEGASSAAVADAHDGAAREAPPHSPTGNESDGHGLDMLFVCLAVIAAVLVVALVGAGRTPGSPRGTDLPPRTAAPSTAVTVDAATRSVVLRI